MLLRTAALRILHERAVAHDKIRPAAEFGEEPRLRLRDCARLRVLHEHLLCRKLPAGAADLLRRINKSVAALCELCGCRDLDISKGERDGWEAARVISDGVVQI